MENAIEIGRAAEHLVVADLILSGYRAFMTEQGMPYDVVIDLDGRLIRVQVKASMSPTNVNANGRIERIAYTWAVRSRGKGRKGVRLDATHCDVVAVVALDIRTVAYLPLEVCGQTIQLSPPGHDLKTKFRSGSQWARTVSDFPAHEAIAGDLSVYRQAGRELTHCVHGHEYTPENTYINSSGYRQCLECRKRYSKEQWEKRKAMRCDAQP